MNARDRREFRVIAHENLLSFIDKGHFVVNGESMIDYVGRPGGRMRHIHIDDNNGKTNEHLVPGMGTIKFNSFIRVDGDRV